MSWVGLLAPAFVVAVSSAQVATLSPTASVSIAIDELDAKEFLIPGVQLPDGRFKYTYEYVDSSGVVVWVNHTVDSLNNPTAAITGQVKYSNLTSVAHTVNAQIVFQACPIIPGGTLFGGSVTMLVVTDANGGGVTCAEGAPAAWQATINGTPWHNVFSCPFQMTKTGSGSLQTSTQFGTPVPSKPGPATAENLGLNHAVNITSGEVLTVTSMLVVKSQGLPSGCTPDLNFDGLVDGSDLAQVLGDWNQAGWCVEGDVDHNGSVNGADVGTILAAWGTCGS